MRKSLVLFLVIAMVGIAFPALAEDVVTIEYWHINSATLGAKAVEESIARFEELNPHIKVIGRFQEGDYGGLLNNLQTAIAAGNPLQLHKWDTISASLHSSNCPINQLLTLQPLTQSMTISSIALQMVL